MKISEIIVLLQQDGWTLNVSPAPAGISPTRRNRPGDRSWQAERYLETQDRASILKQARLRKERP
jgi:hypothetical protein